MRTLLIAGLVFDVQHTVPERVVSTSASVSTLVLGEHRGRRTERKKKQRRKYLDDV